MYRLPWIMNARPEKKEEEGHEDGAVEVEDTTAEDEPNDDEEDGNGVGAVCIVEGSGEEEGID